MNRNLEKQTIGIVAGSGMLPGEVAAEIIASGNSVFVIGIKGEFEGLDAKYPSKVLSFGQLGDVYQTFRDQGVSRIAFVGAVSTRPDFSVLDLDWKTVKTLPKILTILSSGDNTLLSGVIKIFGNEGFETLGVRDVAPNLIISDGVFAGAKPKGQLMKELGKGYNICRRFGVLDTGQALVIESGRIIALEAAEGTDMMLDRVADLRKSGRFTQSKAGGILVKTAKPGQEIRMDLPTIGMETVKRANAAGLSGICLEAGKSIILERNSVKQSAEQFGMFIYGQTAPKDNG